MMSTSLSSKQRRPQQQQQPRQQTEEEEDQGGQQQPVHIVIPLEECAPIGLELDFSNEVGWVILIVTSAQISNQLISGLVVALLLPTWNSGDQI